MTCIRENYTVLFAQQVNTARNYCKTELLPKKLGQTTIPCQIAKYNILISQSQLRVTLQILPPLIKCLLEVLEKNLFLHKRFAGFVQTRLAILIFMKPNFLRLLFLKEGKLFPPEFREIVPNINDK